MHLFIIFIAIIVIAIFQFKSFSDNKTRTNILLTVFQDYNLTSKVFYIPENKIQSIDAITIFQNPKKYSAIKAKTNKLDDTDESEGEEHYIPVSLICVKRKEINVVLGEIIDCINNYLLRNHNAAGDFNLMKDVVERICSKMENEIESEIPIPLYLGLMGTMIGIIVGIGSIAITGGGFSAFVENPSESIGSLMGGVALAMIASLIGILLTTLGTLNNKSTKVNFEQNKNKFYNWLQTELLPSVSESVASTLGLLQRNLTKFNDSFSENVGKMDSTLGIAVDSLTDQTELLNALNDIDIDKFATANIKVLNDLKICFKQFEAFNNYIESVNYCMSKIKSSTDSIERLYNRTQALQELSDYFKKESKAIDQRQKVLAKSAEDINSTFEESLKRIADTSKDNAVRMTGALEEVLKTTNDKIAAINTEIEKTVNSYKALGSTIVSIQKELGQMSSVKEALNRQDKSINDLVMAVRQFHHAVSSTPWGNSERQFYSQKEDTMSIFSSIIKIILFIMALLLFLKYYFNIDFVELI